MNLSSDDLLPRAPQDKQQIHDAVWHRRLMLVSWDLLGINRKAHGLT